MHTHWAQKYVSYIENKDISISNQDTFETLLPSNTYKGGSSHKERSISVYPRHDSFVRTFSMCC